MKGHTEFISSNLNMPAFLVTLYCFFKGTFNSEYFRYYVVKVLYDISIKVEISFPPSQILSNLMT